jgi:hypothetical protein
VVANDSGLIDYNYISTSTLLSATSTKIGNIGLADRQRLPAVKLRKSFDETVSRPPPLRIFYQMQRFLTYKDED